MPCLQYGLKSQPDMVAWLVAHLAHLNNLEQLLDSRTANGKENEFVIWAPCRSFARRATDLAQQGKNTEPQECPVCLILFGALYLLKRPERIYVSVHLAIVVKSVKF